jgi:hypothetical protein
MAAQGHGGADDQGAVVDAGRRFDYGGALTYPIAGRNADQEKAQADQETAGKSLHRIVSPLARNGTKVPGAWQAITQIGFKTKINLARGNRLLAIG